MPTKCPITTLSEWKLLQSDLGSYALAMQAYELNGEEIPTTAKAKELLLDKLPIRGGLLNEIQLNELQREIESGYTEEVSLGKDNKDIRTNLFNYDNPIAEKTVNGVNLRIANGLMRGREKTYLLYANGKIAGEFYSISEIKDTIKYIEDNLVKSIPMGRFQIVGEQAQLAQVVRDNLQVARAMEKAGEDSKTTYLATGWERGVDKFWRYEIPDIELVKAELKPGYSMKEDASFFQKYRVVEDATGLVVAAGQTEEEALESARARAIDKATKLTDVVDENSEVFKAYPQLKDIKFQRSIFYQNSSTKAFYSPSENLIGIQSAVPIKDIRSLLIHEIQHAIQEEEGFARGGNNQDQIDKLTDSKEVKDALWNFQQDMTAAFSETNKAKATKLKEEAKRKMDTVKDKMSAEAYKLYERLAGEVEARNAQKRSEMTEEERRATPMVETEDVSRKDQILYFGDGISEQAQQATDTKAQARPISESSAKFLQTVISAVFPGVTVKFLTQQEYNAKFGTDSNAMVGTDGVVYFNSAKVNATTQVHEFGHVWSSWAKRFAPKLYQQGLALAKADSALIERVSKLYPNLTGDALAEEALATMIGEQGGMMLEEQFDENGNIDQRSFLRKLWDSVRAYFMKNFGVKLGEDFYGDTIGQFSATVASKLISGQKISAFTSEDIANIEQDLGISRAQVSYENTYKNDFFVNDTGIASTPIQEASWQDNAMWLQQDLFEEVNKAVLKAVAKNPDITTGDIVDSGEAANIIRSWFGKTINEIEETVTNRGLHTGKTDENPMNKASDKELVQAKATNSAGGYDADFKIIADQLFLDQNFERETLPKSARNLWDKMVKFRQRQQYLALNSDSLFVSDTEKVAVDDASNIVQEQITKWMQKVNKYKDNKYLGPAIEMLEKYMMKVANMRLWVQLQTGMKSGPLWELMKGMHRGSATANYVKFVAQDMLQPLYKADWLKGGSQTLNKTAKLSELETEDFNGVPLTTEEQFNIFMVLQQKQVRGALMGSEDNPKEAKFYVQEFKGERKGQVVKISYEDYQQLLEKFDSHWDEVNGSWGSAARYIFGQVQDTYKLENGVLLGSSISQGEEEDEKWNIYFPLVHGEGKDAIQTFMKSNSFVNDIASHKMRSPSSEEVYYAGGALGTAEAYIEDNAQYIGFAMPVRNMNLFMKKNEQFFKDNNMEEYVEWWNFTRETIFNPKQSILGSIEQKLLEGFVISRLGLNPFVFLKQFTSIPLASTVIPSKYLTASSKELFGTLTAEMKNYDSFTEWMGRDKAVIGILEEMKTHSPYALSRLTHGVNEMEKHVLAHENVFTKAFEKVTGKKIQMDDFMKWIRSADNATGAMMWTAAKKMVSADMGLTEGSEAYWKAVDDKYTEAVIESQSSIDEINRPKYPKEGTLFAKSLSLFAGQTFSNFNALASHLITYMNNPSAKNRMKFYQSFMNVIVINALMVAAVDTLRSGAIGVEPPDKDEMDIFGEKFGRAMYQNIPIIAPMVDAVISKYENPVFGRDFGYPIFEVVNDGAETIADAMRGKDERAMKEAIYFGAGVAGIPLTPIRTGEKILE